MDKIIITKPVMGLLYMQVCAEKTASDKEILEVCNRENPSGTNLGWANVIRNPENEKQKPVQCAAHPKRMHFMINC